MNYVALGAGRVADESVQKQVDAARKLSFLDPGITWVVRAAGPVHDVVMAIEPVEQSSVRKRWVSLLAPHREHLEKAHGAALSVRSDGLLMLANPGAPALILVPQSEREPLMRRTHEDLQHAGQRRTLRALQSTYTWENMPADVKRFVSNCLICSLSRANLNLAHGQYVRRRFLVRGRRLEWISTR